MVHGDCGSHSACSVSSTSRAKRGWAVPGGAPGCPEQLAGIHTSRPVRCAAELRRWRQALGAWFVQTILDASERLLAGVDLMNRLGRRCAVERLVERPRERRTTLEGLVWCWPDKTYAQTCETPYQRLRKGMILAIALALALNSPYVCRAPLHRVVKERSQGHPKHDPERSNEVWLSQSSN